MFAILQALGFFIVDMKNINRHFKLEAGAPDGARRFIGDCVDAKSLGEKTTTVVTITRTGKFYDPRYGEFEITRNMLLSMVSNFKANAYGQKIFLDVAHDPSKGSAGEIVELMVSGSKLRAQVEFTDYGIEAVKKRGMIYLSAEFMDNFIDNEQRKEHGPTLLGAALTARPVIKHLDPVQLSEDALDEAPPTYLDNKIKTKLTEEGTRTMKKLLAELLLKLQALKLSEEMIKPLMAAFESVGKNLAEEDMQRRLMSEFITQGEAISKELAASGSAPATVTFDTSGIEKMLSEMNPGSGGLTKEDVKKLLAEQQDAQTKTLAEQKTKLDANLKLFNEKIDGVEGLKSLSEDQMKVVKASSDLITHEMTDDQVTKLAEHAIAVGNELAISTQLSGMGFGGTGVVHLNQQNDIKGLQAEINKHLRGTSRFNQGNLILAEEGKENPFVLKVLAEFDRINAPRLGMERKLLAGGEVSISNTNLPAGFERTVLREALSDLRVLTLVQTMVDPDAQATMQIPYETRDTSAIRNNGIVYEGQPIHRAGVTQAMDIAYVLPTKLAMLVTNEVLHFTRASQINWDAYGRNVESNARIVRELLVARICNEMQRSSDAYGAVVNTDEAFDAQLDGSSSLIKTTNFPIVRPHQKRDLQGTAVGSVENPIVMTLNGTEIFEWDGSGDQAAGTYFTITNYNLGYIQLVDKDGTPVTPTDTGVNTMTYSHATNIVKFDLDNGSVDLEKHLNGLLRAFGSSKSAMSQGRFVKPNFSMMSETLNNIASNAAAFEAQSKRNGTDTNNDGDLEMIKAIPGFSTNAPGIDLGDERAILGVRGTLSYGVAKPFVTGETFEAVDPTTGRPTGQKQAYGEEYSTVHVPVPNRNRFTSVIAYSATGRTAA
ncbi:MAG: phage protease [Gammaproteobacteria bacterium]|nr:phage protease [Gammaproteobacteria bacterium]MCW8924513.1 phage protease [Gammaproteobacteria bacterium]